MISELNKLSRQFPNPQSELLRLTELLRLCLHHPVHPGWAEDSPTGQGHRCGLAAAVTDRADHFQSVTAPQAISKVGTTGLEQFFSISN